MVPTASLLRCYLLLSGVSILSGHYFRPNVNSQVHVVQDGFTRTQIITANGKCGIICLLPKLIINLKIEKFKNSHLDLQAL